jgi:Thermolysin metallopeptidase, alpha-helical domain
MLKNLKKENQTLINVNDLRHQGRKFSMEALIRILLYLCIGSGLLSANLWFIHTLKKAFFGRDIVISSFQIIGKEDDKGKLGSTLALMLQAHLEEIRKDIEASQNALTKASESSVPIETSLQKPGFLSTKINKASPVVSVVKPVSIPTELFVPLNIDVRVGGVEVGGMLSLLQRWMVSERSLNFLVYFQGNQAIVTGNLRAFGNSRRDSLWIKISDLKTDEVDANEIAALIAYDLIQRKLSEEQNSKIGVLKPQEFRALVTNLGEVAELNRNVERGRSQTKEFADLFGKTEDLVKNMQITNWYELYYLTGNIAESAEKYDKALEYYEPLLRKLNEGEKITWLDKNNLTNRIETLKVKVESVAINKIGDNSVAFSKIVDDVAYAVDFLNKLFNFKVEAIPVKLLDKSFKNAYWDGNNYNAPPQIQHIPDVTYQQVAHVFIQKAAPLRYYGQSGALVESYADIFASLIKQKRLGQTAETADWTIGPGSIAWLKDEDIPTSKDRSSLRSLKLPGSAYDDPIIGKDPQPDRYQNLYTGESDNKGIHINGGIPNKAFYETAIRIGSDKAGQIWYKALLTLKPESQFQNAATATYQVAGELYGNNSEEQKAVKASWEIVGISPAQPNILSNLN